MIQKQNYVAPAAEQLNVRFEKRFMVESPENPTNESYKDPIGNPNENGWH